MCFIVLVHLSCVTYVPCATMTWRGGGGGRWHGMPCNGSCRRGFGTCVTRVTCAGRATMIRRGGGGGGGGGIGKCAATRVVTWVSSKAWRVNIAKVSYPGRSTETTNFAILAVVDPIWIVTTPSGMEIFESQGHGSLRWTPGGSRVEWRIRSPSRRGDIYTIEDTPDFGSL